MPGIDESTLLALHFDGNVEDDSFQKVSLTNHGAVFDGSEAKFGESAYFGGAQYVEFNLTDDFNFEGKDWTIDFWMYQTTPDLTGAAFCFGDQFFFFCAGGTWQNYIGPQGYTGNVFSSSPNEWVHVAIVCKNNTLTFYKNGQKVYTASMSGNLSYQSGYAAWIGGRNPREGQYFIGYIDEFRVSNYAVWTEDYFTPPTEPYSPENLIEVTLPRENGRTTFCRQFTYNPKGEYNSRRDGAIVSGTPVAGNPVNNLPNGTLINIPENGSPVLFYKAKSDYESDLNGAGRSLVVRKDCYDKRQWNSSNVNAYATSTIDAGLNGDYKALFPQTVQEMMGTTQFYYTPGNGNTAVTTIERSVFLLSLTELGKSNPYCNVEGTVLPISNTLQVAYLDGSAVEQWTRTPFTNGTIAAALLNSRGATVGYGCVSSVGSRPAFTLPATAMVDPTPNPDGSYNLIY